MAASLQMLTIKRLFIVCNRETFAVLFLYVQDGVSGEAGLPCGWCSSGAVLSQGRCACPYLLPSCSAPPGHRGAARGYLVGLGSGCPCGGMHGAAEPRPSVHQSVPWCVQGFTSSKFQETPREAHGGSGLGAARALSQQMCLQGRRAGRKRTNLSLKTFVCSQ